MPTLLSSERRAILAILIFALATNLASALVLRSNADQSTGPANPMETTLSHSQSMSLVTISLFAYDLLSFLMLIRWCINRYLNRIARETALDEGEEMV